MLEEHIVLFYKMEFFFMEAIVCLLKLLKFDF